MGLDHEKFLEHLEPRVDAETLEWIKQRLVNPVYSPEEAFEKLPMFIKNIERERGGDNKYLTMRALEFAAAKLSLEDEEKFLRRLLQ